LIFYYPVRLASIGLFSLYLGFMLDGNLISGQHIQKPMLSGIFFFYRLFQWKYVYHEKTHALLCWYLIIQSNCLGVRLASIG
jgi:hypothetical protein